MEKCKNHDMKIIETNNYGYTSQCDECGEMNTYSVLSAEDNARKVLAGIALVAILGSIICIVIDKIFN